MPALHRFSAAAIFAACAAASLRRGGGQRGLDALSGAAQAPELCGLPLSPFLHPVANVHRSNKVLGAGGFGEVALGTLGDVPVVVKASTGRHGQSSAEQEGDANRELLGGMSVCSAFVPCPPETPVVAYLGGAVEPDGFLKSILLEPVLAPPHAEAVDLATVVSYSASQRKRNAWAAFAVGVSPWLRVGTPALQALRNLDAVLVAVQQVLLGLDVFEARGMRHLDIKAQNIMFDAKYTVKIVDVGLPCAFAQTAEEKAQRPAQLSAGDLATCAGNNNMHGLACSFGMLRGTEQTMSPAIIYLSVHDSIQLRWEECCILNAACHGQTPDLGAEATASLDTFAVGTVLLDFLAAMKDTMGAISPYGNGKSTRVNNLQRSIRIARFLALEEVGDAASQAARREVLRPRVRARAALLLSAAQAKRKSEMFTRAFNGQADFTSLTGDNVEPPMSAAGFSVSNAEALGGSSVCVSAGEPSEDVATFFADQCSADLAHAMTLGVTAGKGKRCDFEAALINPHEDAATKRWLEGKPGTAALMDLLANLLSPSIRPGLAPAEVTIRALADSIDDVRTKMYAQTAAVTDAAKDGLQKYLAGVHDCIDKRTADAAHFKWSHGELAAICRAMKHEPGSATAMKARLIGLSIRTYAETAADIYAIIDDITASNIEYSLAWSKQAPVFAKPSAAHILVVRGRMAPEVKERYDDDAQSAADDDVFLDAFVPAAREDQLAKRISSRPLMRVGATFKRLKGDKKVQTIHAQAERCDVFAEQNGAAVDNRVGDLCGSAQNHDRCYCFAVRSSKGRIKVVRVLADKAGGLDDFSRAVRERTRARA